MRFVYRANLYQGSFAPCTTEKRLYEKKCEFESGPLIRGSFIIMTITNGFCHLQSKKRRHPRVCSTAATTTQSPNSSTMTIKPIFTSSGPSISRRTGNSDSFLGGSVHTYNEQHIFFPIYEQALKQVSSWKLSRFCWRRDECPSRRQGGWYGGN